MQKVEKNKFKEMAELIAKKGGKLYLVGGAVRDSAMHITPKDYDFCVTGISQEELSELFPKAFLKGKDFTVFDLDGMEFALARKERKSGKGHKEFEIETDKSITIEEDLLRRDLTINSIAFDIIEKKFIDPFGGIKDIENKVIRATSEAFKEDPLRVYRAARFASKYGFTISEDTLKLMHEVKGELGELSPERVFGEFQKALKSDHPSAFFNSLRACDCLDVHFPEIAKMIGIPQPEKYHPEGDVYNHTMEVIERTAKKTDDETVRFSALVHDFGKILTPPEILPHHYDHEKNGDEPIKAFCNRIKTPAKYRKAGLEVSRDHMLAGKFFELRNATKVDFLDRVSKSVVGLDGMEIIANCDSVRNPRIEFSEIGKEMLKSINGKTVDLSGLSPDQIKDRLRQLKIMWLKKYMEKNYPDDPE